MNKPKYRIQVITKVPPHKSGNNLYDEIMVEQRFEFSDSTHRPFDYQNEKKMPTKFLHVKLPVFELGEIIVVDECDREVGGEKRKPSKWLVEYKEFKLEDIEKAIRLAKKLSKY